MKDRHETRVASGQKIPDIGDLTKIGSEEEEESKGLLSPSGATNGQSPGETMEPISEGEDIADRAASLLQGLRGNGDGDTEGKRPESRDGSLRVRRRRESADDERRSRRRRRNRESSSTAGGDEGDTLSPRDTLSPKQENSLIPEIQEPEDEDTTMTEEGIENTPPVAIPSSPEGTVHKPVVLDD